MVTSEQILALDENVIQTSEKCCIVISKGIPGLPNMGTPVIAREASFNESRVSNVYKYFAKRQIFESPVPLAQSTTLIDSKRVIHDRLVKPIERFDFNKAERICDYVKEYGAVSFIMENEEGPIEFLSSALILKEAFPYMTDHGYNNNFKRRDRTDVSLITILSFYDLIYSVPIFYSQKVRGFGVHLGVLWADNCSRGSLRFEEEFWFAVNKFPENILTVDGSLIRGNCQMESAYRQHLINILSSIQKDKKEHTQHTQKVATKAKQKKVEGDDVSKDTDFLDLSDDTRTIRKSEDTRTIGESYSTSYHSSSYDDISGWTTFTT